MAKTRLNQKNRNLIEVFVISGGYLLLFLCLHEAVAHLEVLPGIRVWYLPAGLTLALLLAYGPVYSIAVLAAHLLALLWLQSPQFPIVWGIALSAATAAVYALNATLLRRALWSGSLQLRTRESAGQLVLGGSLTGVMVGMVNSMTMMLVGAFPLEALPRWTLESAVGHVTAILAFAPFLLLFVIPKLKSALRRFGRGKVVSEGVPLAEEGGGILQLFWIGTLSAALLWCISFIPPEAQFLRFCVLLLPLIWVALAAGLEGSATASFLLAGGFVFLLRAEFLQLETTSEMQLFFTLAVVNAILVAAAVTQRHIVEKANNYRHAVLGAVSLAAESVSTGDDWDENFSNVLSRLGQAAEVSHVYLLQAHYKESGVKFDQTSYEWTSEKMSAEEHQQDLMNLVQSHHLEDNLKTLEKGEAYAYEVTQLDKKERAIAEALGLRSSVIVPIILDDRLWGCLGLDRSFEEPEWEQPEIEALLSVAQSLGALMARAQIEEQFRQLFGNIRAVFWSGSPDGYSRTYVSRAYEQIWGSSIEALHERPNSWLDVIHREDLPQVKEALEDQVRDEYDIEYRLVLPSGGVRWIHDRGSAVKNRAGEVRQIVGIAEDISSQKEAEDRIRGTTQLLSVLIDSLRSGILVEDESRKVRWVNHAFCKMFDIPVEKDSLVGTDSRLLYAGSRSLGERIEEIISRGNSFTGEKLQYEGKVFHRDYLPLSISKYDNYHLWQYQNITDQKKAEDQIKASLREKEVLLQEIHHRVKNNLQVISSLLSLQSSRISDQQALQIFSDSQNRVRAMALVHERLYQSEDLARIDFSGYAEVLMEHLMHSYGAKSNVKLEMEVEPVQLDVDMAIPCGLIVNELVSNSLKYAFPDGRDGEILIHLSQRADELRLLIKDDGVGFKKEVELQTTQSLGLKLVRSLAKQLGGSLSYKNDDGTEFDIRFRHESGTEAKRFTA